MRQADIGFALVLLVLAVIVAAGSLQLDIGWGMNGPKGGFFPFWLAVGLGLCCLVILVQALRSTSPTSRQPLVRPGGWGAAPQSGWPSDRDGGPHRDHRSLSGCCPLHRLLHAVDW
jgi:hypothetical protein